tara:strand:+ start:611 stop:2266 length:1656 start_codon:yes stop_codon:yes gene_type:complete
MKALGVEQVIISPGSRSTPLVLSAQVVDIQTKVILDERVAAFYALGRAKHSGIPSILVCTSGTAAANYLPAVVEANHAGTPMIICSADRPPEKRLWGAGQTITQAGLYGENVRWSYDLPVVSEVDEALARSVALRAWDNAVTMKGPVHLNWPFREPLEPKEKLSPPVATLKPFNVSESNLDGSRRLQELATAYERGLLVVGPNNFKDEDLHEVISFSRLSGWPILADPGSQMRGGDISEKPNILTTAEILCGSQGFTDNLPQTDVIIQIGLSPTSKAYRNWMETKPPKSKILISPGTDWSDPSHDVTEVYRGSPANIFSLPNKQIRSHSEWLSAWLGADLTAREVIHENIIANESEISAISAICSGTPNGTTLVLSNSMVIRDAELAILNTGNSFRTITNRGANGIDGVVSTSIGVAEANKGNTVCILGDIAAVHDIGGFLAALRLQTELTIVVLDNGGGGIFSFLPVKESIEEETFKEFYLTPPKLPVPEILIAAGVDVRIPTSLNQLTEEVTSTISEGGLKVIWYRTDSDETVRNFTKIRQDFEGKLSN